MKKVLAILLALLMVLSMVACSSKQETSDETAKADAATPAEATDTDETADTADSTEADADTADTTEVQKVVYGFPGTAARLNFVNDDGTYDGYEIAIIRELDARLPQYEFELYCAGEFSALTPGLDAGKFNMVGSNITWKQERADNYLYSEVSY